jgi:hypothetical protein
MTRAKQASLLAALAALAGLVALGASALPAAAATGAPPRTTASRERTATVPQVCPGVNAPTLAGAITDSTMNNMFNSYADDVHQYDHWTGADGTYSASLPGHQELWIFSDTFLGTVNPDGTRSPTISDGGTTPFINNSFVQQQPGDTAYTDLATIHGGTAAKPAALMPPPDATHWYWAGDAIASGAGGGTLQAVYQEYVQFGTGGFDFKWFRNVVARYAPGHLSAPIDVRELPSATGVAWGAWLMRADGFTYVYGVEDLGANKYVHLARVPGDDLLGAPWQYYAGNGTWSADEAAAIRLPYSAATDGYLHVANEYSVSRMGDVYVLITQNTTQPLSPEIDAYFSCSPGGPFADKTPVYNEPEMGHGGRNHDDPNVFTYNAHAHPEVSTGNTLLISYNENSFVNTDLYNDASIYEPRFIDVTFAGTNP